MPIANRLDVINPAPMHTQTLIGVGVGPGDPELLTLKAVRLIQQADIIAYIANASGESQARNIAATVLDAVDKSQREMPVIMPMSNDRTLANQAYDQAAIAISEAVTAQQKVVFLCEGDPLFFGSFAYLLTRLQAANIPCAVVPGISSVHAASAALQTPLSLLQESFAVMSGRHSEAQLVAALNTHESVVIMKAGRCRQKIRRALAAAGRSDDARYLEYIGREAEVIHRDIQCLEDEAGPYFSLFVVTKTQRDYQ
ncbi:MAG: precorrin-2 C(20)-methyltransferase [Cellvibrionaceae bacterium]|nr:precorrin-2 C(20)-methyltransferase [Cellvibrionaceae bacterium]